MEKNLTSASLPSPNKRNRQWQLMLVGDNGNITTLNRFKTVGLFLGITMLLVFVLLILFVVLYKKYQTENAELKIALSGAQKQIAALENEKDVLMTRLVRAESRIGREPAVDVKDAPQTSPPDPAPSVQTSPTRAENVEKSQASDGTVDKKSTQQPDSATVIAPDKVDIRNFTMTHYPRNETLRIRFTIHNTVPSDKTVAGYIFVVLTDSEQQISRQMVIPSVDWVDGEPAEIKRGQYFKISRYKTVHFRVENCPLPERFHSATVLVFNEDGNVLYRQSMPVSVKSMGPHKPSTAETDTDGEKS